MFQFWYHREIDDEIFKKPENTEQAKMDIFTTSSALVFQVS